MEDDNLGKLKRWLKTERRLAIEAMHTDGTRQHLHELLGRRKQIDETLAQIDILAENIGESQ